MEYKILSPYEMPDKNGHFGQFGGRYASETLMPCLIELADAYEKFRQDKSFNDELNNLLINYAGRPTPVFRCRRLEEKLGGARIYLKREDLLHTGAHKINNTLGQVLLAKKMGKSKVIAETGAGQHGVATATTAALFGMECRVFMGETDVQRQQANVRRMELLGASVIPVTSGSATLKDAMNEAMRNWIANVKDTFYVIGSVAGPHPYPMMVRDFQRIIGMEIKNQMLKIENRLPDLIIACVGGGSNAMGAFYDFIDEDVELAGVESAGKGIKTEKHAATLTMGSPGVLHGSKSYVLQNNDGQINEAHSISAGLDYPGVGPEHSYLKESGRVRYEVIDDNEALEAFHLLCKTEGIIPALESVHAVAQALKEAPKMSKNSILVINLSGRGDKDLDIVAGHFEQKGEKNEQA